MSAAWFMPTHLNPWDHKPQTMHPTQLLIFGFVNIMPMSPLSLLRGKH